MRKLVVIFLLALSFQLALAQSTPPAAKPKIRKLTFKPRKLKAGVNNQTILLLKFKDSISGLRGGYLHLELDQEGAEARSLRLPLSDAVFSKKRGKFKFPVSFAPAGDGKVFGSAILEAGDGRESREYTFRCRVVEEEKPYQFVESLPEGVQDDIVWHAGHETGDFSEWEDYGTDGYYSGGGIFITDRKNTATKLSSGIYFSGAHSIATSIFNAYRAENGNKAVRLMRWTDKPWDKNGDYFPVRAYYSVWICFPHQYNPNKYEPWDPGDGGWWNTFQFKSDNHAGSQPVVTLDIYFDEDNQQMHYGLVTKDYPDHNSYDHTQTYHMQDDPLPIPVNRWFHVEVYLEKTKSYDGRIAVWQDGIKIFDITGVRTSLIDDITWGIGNYTDHIAGGPVEGEATIYFDDAVVSRSRISAHLP